VLGQALMVRDTRLSDCKLRWFEIRHGGREIKGLLRLVDHNGLTDFLQSST
jgi:hypothetical protein